MKKKPNSHWTHFMRGPKMGPDPFWKIQILLNSHSKIHEKKASDSPFPTENKIIHGSPGIDYHYNMEINKKNIPVYLYKIIYQTNTLIVVV